MATYNYNPLSSGVARVGASAVGGAVGAAGPTGGNAIKTAYMPQGFQADFGSGEVASRGEGGREAAPEPMHVRKPSCTGIVEVPMSIRIDEVTLLALSF